MPVESISDDRARSSDAVLAAVDDPPQRSNLSVRALTEGLLDRVDKWQPYVNAFVTVTRESALREADDADQTRAQGVVRGAAEGLVIGVKDDIEVAGVRCTIGSSFFREYIPARDAEVVRRLRASGAVLLGKLMLSEFALGSTSANIHYGDVRNPWNPALIPGGSSGGPAAAVATDCCIASLGSDGGGSIRIPAALCGVTGLCPTRGSISPDGSYPIVPTTETLGVLARSARDVARVFAAVCKQPRGRGEPMLGDLLNDGVPDIRSLRVGLPRPHFFDDLQPDVAAAVEAVAQQLAALGAEVRDVEVEGAAEIVPVGRTIIVVDGYAIHEERLRTAPEGYGAEVRERLLLGSDVNGAQFARMLEQARQFSRHLDTLFDEIDILLTPTTDRVACERDGAGMIEESRRLSRLTLPFSVSGSPALSVPCGFDRNGLPIGAQLVGPRWCDDVVLRAGAAYQQVTDWHRRRPSLP
jgi:aspartyl-tRNA(Asn)/glutamyl-tRNA(Gln) amidotransferase subunit A